MKTTYHDQLKQVFSNTAGQELLEEWQKMYSTRASYRPGMSFEETASRDAERMFVQYIIEVLKS